MKSSLPTEECSYFCAMQRHFIHTAYYISKLRWVFLLLVILADGHLWAKTNPPVGACLFNFGEGWKDEMGNTLNIPFEREDQQSILLSHSFCLNDSIPDTAYLYFEGIAWVAELELNGKYLDVHEVSFDPWIIPVASQFLYDTLNVLKVRLSLGERKEFYPRPFLGIFRPAYLLTASQIDSLQNPILPKVDDADTLCIIAPYFGDSYAFDPYEASRIILPVHKRSINFVHFAFPPDREFRRYCQSLGLIEVEQIKTGNYLGLVNEYPYEPAVFRTKAEFWLDESGYRTANYGDLYPAEKSYRAVTDDEHSLLLVLIILFPLISLFLIKLLSRGFFSSQLAMLFKPKLFLEPSMEASLSNRGLLYILQALKALNGATFLSLLVYYIQNENQWQILNVFTDWSLINQIFYLSDTLFTIFMKSLFLLTAWTVCKQLFMGLIGVGFRMKGIGTAYMGLEIVRSYPLALILSTPIALILYLEKLWGGIMAIFLVLILLIYASRSVYVLFIGLDRLFSFSSAVKFLYICTFNVLPYIILL